jgi:hypothetical protein
VVDEQINIYQGSFLWKLIRRSIECLQYGFFLVQMQIEQIRTYGLEVVSQVLLLLGESGHGGGAQPLDVVLDDVAYLL